MRGQHLMLIQKNIALKRCTSPIHGKCMNMGLAIQFKYKSFVNMKSEQKSY